MKVFVKGKGEVSLSQSNFVAQGGQASVYQKNGTAYKVYTDAKDAIPEAKFLQLAGIQDAGVVKPRDLLLASSGAAPIGYTMDFVHDTYSLCQVFPKSFRDRNNVGHETIRAIAEELQGHVENVHRAGVLVVDMNELNILVRSTFNGVFMIDVDSYQTAGFRAEVIMPSVRDWSVSSAKFSELSDWFSFAVLVCQLSLGIHPYRGQHAGSAAVPPDQRLEHRMRKHISVFDPSVSVPKVCFPFDVIPAHQRAWLKAVLQDGKRLPPPPPGGLPAVVIVTAVAVPAVTFGGQLIAVELARFDGAVLACAEAGSERLVLTANGVELNGHRVHGPLAGTTLLGFTPKMGRPIGLTLYDGALTFHEFAERRATSLRIAATELAKSGERFYIRNGTQVLEVDFTDSAAGTVVTASHPVANVLESASRLFDGVAIQNMLGSTFVSLFPRTRAGYQARIAELDAHRIVDAKFEGGVLMVVGARGGAYERLVFRFDETFSTYDLRVVPNIAPTGLNFVTTASGICVSVTEDEKIEAFGAAKGASGVRVIEDKAVGGDMRLMHVAGRVGFARGSALFSLGMKP